MAPKKDFRHNKNYFTRNDALWVIGIIIAVIGLLLWLDCWTTHWSRLMNSLSVIIFFVGIVLAVLGKAGRSRLSDIEYDVSDACKNAESEIASDENLVKRLPGDYKEYTFSEYIQHENVIPKRTRSGSLITTEYFYGRILCLKKSFYTKTLSFSLIEDKREDNTAEIAFDSVEDIISECSEITAYNGKKSFRLHPCYLIIKYDGGKEVRFAKNDDAYTDELIAELKKICGLA